MTWQQKESTDFFSISCESYGLFITTVASHIMSFAPIGQFGETFPSPRALLESDNHFPRVSQTQYCCSAFPVWWSAIIHIHFWHCSLTCYGSIPRCRCSAIYNAMSDQCMSGAVYFMWSLVHFTAIKCNTPGGRQKVAVHQSTRMHYAVLEMHCTWVWDTSIIHLFKGHYSLFLYLSWAWSFQFFSVRIQCFRSLIQTIKEQPPLGCA